MSLIHQHSSVTKMLMDDTSHYRNEGETPSDEDSSRVLVAKGVTMAVLCTVSTCMGILPMLLAKWFKWDATGHVNPR